MIYGGNFFALSAVTAVRTASPRLIAAASRILASRALFSNNFGADISCNVTVSHFTMHVRTNHIITQLMSSNFFCYDLRFHEQSKELVLFGRRDDSTTIAWRVQVPSLVLYLEHAKQKESLTAEQVRRFFASSKEKHAALPELCLFDIHEPREYSIAPVVSFQASRTQFTFSKTYNYSGQEHINGADVPVEWNDEQKPYSVRKSKLDSLRDDLDNLKCSPLHRAGPNQVFATKITFMNGNVLESEILRRNLQHLRATYSDRDCIITQLWHCTQTRVEYFLNERKIQGPGWLEYNGSTTAVPMDSPDAKRKNRLTNCHEEYLLQDWNLVSPSISVTPRLAPKFNVLWFDCDLEKLVLGTQTLCDFTHFQSDPGSEIRWHTIPLGNYTKDEQNAKAIKMIRTGLESLFAAHEELRDIQFLVTYKSHADSFKSKLLLKFHSFLSRFEEGATGHAGIIACDAFHVFNHKEFFPRAPSTQLGQLAETHKLKKKYPARIICAQQRMEIVSALFQMANIFELFAELSRITSLPCNGTSALFISQMVQTLHIHWYASRGFIIRQHRSKHQQHQLLPVTIPLDDDSNEAVESKAEGRGGLVLNCKPGVHRIVGVLDGKSYYPSIIQALNLCFSTFKVASCVEFRAENVDLSLLEPFQPDHNDMASVNNARGVLASIEHRLTSQRGEIDRLLSDAKTSAEKESLRAQSKCLKFIANGIYGNYGNPTNSFYCPAIAQYITGFGQAVLQEAAELLTSPAFLSHRIEVIGGITDSLFVKAGTDLQVLLNRELYPVNVQFNEDHMEVETPLESNLLDHCAPTKSQVLATQRQYDLWKSVMDEAAKKLSDAISGMRFGVEALGLVMALPYKQKHTMIPFLRPEINSNLRLRMNIAQSRWKGFTLNQMGFAKFVLTLRPLIFFEIMILCQDHIHAEASSVALDLFYDRLSSHLRSLVLRMKSKQFTLDEFKIIGQVNTPLHITPPCSNTNGCGQSATIATQIARLLNELHEQRDPLGECVAVKDCVEYVVCYDFTRYDHIAYLPYHMVAALGPEDTSLQVNIEWYLKKHLVDALHQIVSPFGFATRDQLITSIQRILDEKQK